MTRVNYYYFPAWKRKTRNTKDSGSQKETGNVLKEGASCLYVAALTEALGGESLFFLSRASTTENKCQDATEMQRNLRINSIMVKTRELKALKTSKEKAVLKKAKDVIAKQKQTV